MDNRCGLSDAEVLAVLYNRSRPLGMGFLQFDPTPMSVAEAGDILKNSRDGYFDYLRGRVMKIDVKEKPLDFRLYDRDNGQGWGATALLEWATRPVRQDE